MSLEPSNVFTTSVKYNEDGLLPFYSINSILSDKIHVLGDRKVCRRVKDLIDVYFILQYRDVEYLDLIKSINTRGSLTGRSYEFSHPFILDLNNFESISHAFNKYEPKLNVEFKEFYSKVISFTLPIFNGLNGNLMDFSHWDCKKGEWVYAER